MLAVTLAQLLKDQLIGLEVADSSSGWLPFFHSLLFPTM